MDAEADESARGEEEGDEVTAIPPAIGERADDDEADCAVYEWRHGHELGLTTGVTHAGQNRGLRFVVVSILKGFTRMEGMGFF
jgi:hypothetical protein